MNSTSDRHTINGCLDIVGTNTLQGHSQQMQAVNEYSSWCSSVYTQFVEAFFTIPPMEFWNVKFWGNYKHVVVKEVHFSPTIISFLQFSLNFDSKDYFFITLFQNITLGQIKGIFQWKLWNVPKCFAPFSHWWIWFLWFWSSQLRTAHISSSNNIFKFWVGVGRNNNFSVSINQSIRFLRHQYEKKEKHSNCWFSFLYLV